MTDSKNVSKKSESIMQMALTILIFLLFAFIALYLSVTYWQSSQRRTRLQEQLHEHKVRLNKIRRRKRMLIEKNRLLRDNERAVEYLLREKYGLLKPDEFRIVEAERPQP